MNPRSSAPVMPSITSVRSRCSSAATRPTMTLVAGTSAVVRSAYRMATSSTNCSSVGRSSTTSGTGGGGVGTAAGVGAEVARQGRTSTRVRSPSASGSTAITR